MKTIQFLSALFISFVLVGCAGTTEIQKEVVTNTQLKVVSTPETLLEKCSTTSPPEKTIYLAGTDKDRIELLITYSQDLIKDLAKCNNNIDKIQKLQRDQLIIYNKAMEKHE